MRVQVEAWCIGGCVWSGSFSTHPLGSRPCSYLWRAPVTSLFLAFSVFSIYVFVSLSPPLCAPPCSPRLTQWFWNLSSLPMWRVDVSSVSHRFPTSYPFGSNV